MMRFLICFLRRRKTLSYLLTCQSARSISKMIIWLAAALSLLLASALALPSQIALQTKPKLVSVQLAVMSKCPDAQFCETVMDRVFPVVKDKISAPKTIYIGQLNSSSPYGVSCMHGPSECRGNIQQLCVRKHSDSWQNWWRFIGCQNYSPSRYALLLTCFETD
jgi:hypothetical protein